MPESPPRLVIANVTPAVDGGRYAVKRIVGDVCAVGVDVLKDGHDILAARLCVRGPGDTRWSTSPLTYSYPEDRWSGSFVPTRVGRWLFTIEAWTDWFATWQHALRARLEAGLEPGPLLPEGVALVSRAAAAADAGVRDTLQTLVEALGRPGTDDAEILRIARDEATAALVRAHLPPTDLTRHPATFAVTVDRERARFAAWYEFFPRSQTSAPDRPGTFADAERRLHEIAALGFDVIYLPPIHPIGRTSRKGPNNAPIAGPEDPGSPWAIGSEHGGHTAVDPGLGTLADFARFVRTAESLGMEVALDFAPHCSPDHPWIREHPDWFVRWPDGSLRHAENPPHVFEDVVPLDFWCADRATMWAAWRDVLVFWVAQGVRAFRIDNPHTKPFAFWEWVIAEVRREHPEVIFLAEAFTRPKPMRALAKLGFTQSYTYFIWRTGAAELREYLTELTQTELAEYLRGNLFPNTPDVLHAYLQSGGRPAFRIRLLLAATLSPLYGIYSGFELCEATPMQPGSEEYLDSEKYRVRVRDWHAEGNLNGDLALLNQLRRTHRALQLATNLTFHGAENEQMLFYRRAAPRDVDGGDANDLLIAVTVDPHHVQEGMVHVPLEALGLAADEPYAVEDLLSGERYTWRGARNYVRLDPAERVGQIFRIVRERPDEPADPAAT